MSNMLAPDVVLVSLRMLLWAFTITTAAMMRARKMRNAPSTLLAIMISGTSSKLFMLSVTIAFCVVVVLEVGVLSLSLESDIVRSVVVELFPIVEVWSAILRSVMGVLPRSDMDSARVVDVGSGVVVRASAEVVVTSGLLGTMHISFSAQQQQTVHELKHCTWLTVSVLL